MKSLKLLLVSFTITFLALITISPASAQPSIKVQHLNINNSFTAKLDNFNLNMQPSKLSTQYSNNFSSGLILPSSKILGETNSLVAMTVVNKSTNFFSGTMVFNDKLHQIISFFTSADTKAIIEQDTLDPQSNVLKEKCSSRAKLS